MRWRLRRVAASRERVCKLDWIGVAAGTFLSTYRDFLLIEGLAQAQWMVLGRIVWRIEQHQRIPAHAESMGVHCGGHCRERMEYARGALCAKLTLDRGEDLLQISYEARPVMILETV